MRGTPVIWRGACSLLDRHFRTSPVKIFSLNISLPEEILINERPVLTGIYKKPVTGTIALGKLGFAGDGQGDRTVHGGEFQAVYGYASEHYAYWENYLQQGPLAPGFFGENLTTIGLLETEACVGNIYQIGTAQVQVTMHRLPCFKFSHKVHRPEILKDFLRSGFSGIYFKVIEEGKIEAGDAISLIHADPERISVRTLLGMHRLGEFDPATAERALTISALPPLIRNDFLGKLARPSGSHGT